MSSHTRLGQEKTARHESQLDRKKRLTYTGFAKNVKLYANIAIPWTYLQFDTFRTNW